MDVNKAIAFMDQYPKNKFSKEELEEDVEVDIKYIIEHKPPTKIVREYFKVNIADLSETE